VKTNPFKILQQRAEVKLNKRVFVFIVCLIIAFISWLQINLSQVYIENIPVRVDFVNLPKTKFGTSRMSDTLMLEAEANGFSLLKYEQKAISIDFRKLKRDNSSGTYYFLPNNFTKTFSNQLGENYKIIKPTIDTMELNPTFNK